MKTLAQFKLALNISLRSFNKYVQEIGKGIYKFLFSIFSLKKYFLFSRDGLGAVDNWFSSRLTANWPLRGEGVDSMAVRIYNFT